MTEQRKFTPGPWQTSVQHDATGYPLYAIHGFGGEEKRDEVMHAANAALIAAAPEMYAELQKQIDWLEHIKGRIEVPRSVMLGIGQALKGMRAVLAKAEGRT